MSQTFCETFVLTVAEGKRLIAKGVAALPAVKEALKNGIILICKGTTNAYVAEELLGEKIAKGAYVLGRTVPAKADTRGIFTGQMPEIVLVKGERRELTMQEALTEMQRGDVVIKGANALNYEAGIVGLLVGDPTGGTVGKIIGPVYGKGLHWICPVGLEKQIAEDILDLAEQINHEPELSRRRMPALWPAQPEIITEIEALQLLTGVEARQIAAGGVCGAEGGIWLAAWGNEEQIAAAKALIESVQGEPPFGQE